MALNLQPKAQLIFFEKVFGGGHSATHMAKDLIAKGVDFEVQLVTIKATFPGGKIYQLNLTKGSTTLMKEGQFAIGGPVGVTKQSITNWLTGLLNMPINPKPISAAEGVALGGVPLQLDPAVMAELKVTICGLSSSELAIPVIKAIRELTGCDLATAKGMTDKVIGSVYNEVVVKVYTDKKEALNAFIKLTQAGAKSNILDGLGNKVTPANINPAIAQTELFQGEPVKAANKPTIGTIKLRDAKALGQKVTGTSGGSVYHTVAYNDRVKVAARIYKSQGTVSLRAEWNAPTSDELKRLGDAGLNMKSDYASMHLQLGEVPMGRVIGAFLMGLGINFSEVVTYEGNLVAE